LRPVRGHQLLLHPPEWNALVSDEGTIAITNALSEAIEAMRLSLLPGLLETVAFNRFLRHARRRAVRSRQDYHRQPTTRQPCREYHRIAIVLYGSIGTFWGDAKRPVDFLRHHRGSWEQIASKMHVDVTFAAF